MKKIAPYYLFGFIVLFLAVGLRDCSGSRHAPFSVIFSIALAGGFVLGTIFSYNFEWATIRPHLEKLFGYKKGTAYKERAYSLSRDDVFKMKSAFFLPVVLAVGLFVIYMVASSGIDADSSRMTLGWFVLGVSWVVFTLILAVIFGRLFWLRNKAVRLSVAHAEKIGITKMSKISGHDKENEPFGLSNHSWEITVEGISFEIAITEADIIIAHNAIMLPTIDTAKGVAINQEIIKKEGVIEVITTHRVSQKLSQQKWWIQQSQGLRQRLPINTDAETFQSSLKQFAQWMNKEILPKL